ncbi:hypothetical protein [Desulfobacula toluolica]|uniref:Uncharacterized protein n=1 Tax=Desulfobacula toluolica (strain DSM 7467 / Tol2) TaxID=651182 RepID=K0NNF2_DESTT|nr:hypothetical protein [Desulfobacula toluolica]CCK82175.1 uncharacterized protein TOL2_C40200 [Desulfobacula toluolica Tol2]
MTLDISNIDMRNQVVDEYIETLKNDWMGEVALAAGLALAFNQSQHNYIKKHIRSLFLQMKNRMRNTGRNLQTAACYPLLFMEDREFFESISADDFRPNVPPRIDELLEADLIGDMQKSLEMAVYYEGIDDGVSGTLFQKVLQMFPKLSTKFEVPPVEPVDSMNAMIDSLKNCFRTELENIELNPEYSDELKSIFKKFRRPGAIDMLFKDVIPKVELALQDSKPHNCVVGLTDHPVQMFLDVRPGINLNTLGKAWQAQTGHSYVESIPGLLLNAEQNGLRHVLHLFFCFDENQSGVAIAFLPPMEDVPRIGSLIPYSMHPLNDHA